MNGVWYHIIIGVLKVLAHLPLCVLYVIGDVLSFVAHRLVRYRVAVVRKNLRNALPELSDDERRRIERAFYRHLGDCIVETVKLLHIGDDEIGRRIEVRNSGIIDEAVADGHSVIMFLGHYGNWEWVQAASMYFHCDVSGAIYRELYNKTMNRVIHRIRSRFGNVNIPQEKAVRTLLRMHSEGKRFVIGFIADQYPNSWNFRYWTDFLNQRAAYVTGGEEIGRHVDARYVYLEVDKPRRGHYVMTLKPLTAPADSSEKYPHTLMFLREFEAHIRRSPEYWLWSHNRWRHKEPKPKTTDPENR